MFILLSNSNTQIKLVKSNLLLHMSGSKKLVLLRLQKEQRRLHDDPLENAWVAREGLLNFHFCVYGLDGVYEGGYYHGVLELSQEYPFAPPKLMFYTPSGRFEICKPICTSFTNFHKETWTSSWTVRTMVTATISFMTSEEQGAGYLGGSYLTRRNYAKNSLQHNLNNPLFKQLFKKQIKELETKGNLPTPKSNSNEKDRQKSQESNERQKAIQPSTKLYVLYILLVAIVALWAISKN